MVDIGAITGKISAITGPFFTSIADFVNSTQLPAQLRDVDYVGLFTNPWFFVPFLAWVGYSLYKQAFRGLILAVIILGVWWVSGTSYMHTLIIGDRLQIGKVLPVLFGGAGILALVMYLFFGRS